MHRVHNLIRTHLLSQVCTHPGTHHRQSIVSSIRWLDCNGAVHVIAKYLMLLITASERRVSLVGRSHGGCERKARSLSWKSGPRGALPTRLFCLCVCVCAQGSTPAVRPLSLLQWAPLTLLSRQTQTCLRH
jgi:hypothetical protein